MLKGSCFDGSERLETLKVRLNHEEEGSGKKDETERVMSYPGHTNEENQSAQVTSSEFIIR
jgi:hypothetical protein